MSLSSILAGFKQGLKDVGTKVATEANLFREAASDTGSKAYDTVQGVKTGITDYAKGVVNKEIALQKADPSAASRPLYDIVGDFRKADAAYKASGNRNAILDTISGVANAPISIAEGVGIATDSSKSIGQRTKGVTDVGLGLVSLTPATAGYQAAYNLFAPQAAKQSVERGSSQIIENLSTTGQKLGLSKDNADAVGGILFNLASIYAGAKGPKAGSAVEKSLTKAGIIPAKTAGVIANAAVQASPNLFSMAVDHLQNGGTISNADALYDTMAQSLALVPMGKVKGLSAKLNKEPVAEQMQLPDEAPAITSDMQAYNNALIASGKAPAFMKGKVDTPTASDISSKSPAYLRPSETTVPTPVTALDRKNAGFLDTQDIQPITALDRKNASLSAKLANSPETPVLSNTEVLVAPVKEQATTIAKGEEAPMLNSDTSNGFDVPKTTTTSISKALSDISNSLSLDNLYVSKSKNIANSAGTIGGYVEKGLSKVLNRDINLRNITQSARNSANLFSNKILESVGIDKTKSDITRKVDIKPEDVVGGVTPNEGTTITSIKQVAPVIDNIIPNAVKNFVGKKSVGDLENQAKAEYIYEVNKGNPEKLNTLLSPQEQSIIQYRIAARDKASSDLAQHLVDNGFLKDKDLADSYVRYVLSEAGRDKLRSAESVTIPINGKDYKFDNIDQALTSMMARRKTGDGHIADSMETAISSIMKEKATGIDTLRVHSPTVQLLSYAMEVGKLLQNKAVLDNFRKFQKGSDGLPTPESKFIEGLFPDHGPSEKLENIIGINRRDAGISGKAQDLLSNITKGTSTAILAGRVGTAIQPFFSSVPKGGLVALKNILTGNGVSLRGIKDQKVGEILDANGFTPDYQVFDTSGAGKAESGLHWLAAESSGRTPELYAKTYTSLSEMRRVLNDNITEAKKTMTPEQIKNSKYVSSNPIDIVTSWEKFARDPKNKDQYLIAQDRIQETLDWMGGSTIFNKSMNDIVRKTNFQSLTGYANGQVNKAMSDIGRVFLVIETGEKGSGQQIDAAKRLAGTAAIWGTVAAGAYAYLKNENPDASEDSLMDMAMQYANKQAGNPLQSWYAITSGVTNSPLAAGLGVMKDAITTGYSFLTDSPDKKVQADMLLNNIIKMQGGLNTIDTISGGKLTQGAADMLGTVNTSDITTSGNARGMKDYGLSAALLGFKPNAMMQNYLYGKVNEASLKESLGVKDDFIGNQIVNAATLGKEWVRKVMTPLQDIANSLTPDRTDWGRMQAIHDTYKKLNMDDTASSFLGKIGVTDPNLQELFAKEIGTLVKNEQGNITKKSATGNEFAASLTGVGGKQRIVVDNFGKMMGDLEISNPYLYNQILAGATSISQEVARRGGEFPADKNTEAVVKKLMSSSSSKDDAAIAGITQHNPNSTAFGQALWTTFDGIVGGNPTAKDTQKGLKFLDGIMGEVYKGGQYTTGLERSIALKAFSVLPGIASRIKEYGGAAIGELLSGMPFLSHALQQGLRYRGWVPAGSATSPAPATKGLSSKLGTSGTKTSTSTTSTVPTIEGLTTLPTDTKAKGKSGKLDLKDKYYRSQPGQTGKVLSLTELLSRK